MTKRRNIARQIILALAGLMSTALVLAPARLASAQAVAPSWSYTGNLNTAPSSATLLPSGKVLIAGANFGISPPYSLDLAAELYDPAARSWSSTGSARNTSSQPPGLFGHTATLLLNGKVLVAGGSMGDGSFETAELYDPVTGTWSYTGALLIARESHTATLLPNGKVLIAAGWDYDYNSLNRAELYDPATGMWSDTGSLNSSRVYHTATFLPNGKVLVVGGIEGSGYGPAQALNSAELYDPATGMWSNTGSLNTARSDHTATLLPSGKVLVVGNDVAELYDPATGTWAITASPKRALVGPATLLPNGNVLVASFDKTAELYDPGTNPTPNKIDDPQFFVRQHYRDFLNRESDPDGLAFWTNQINMCGADQGCIDAKRVSVSAAFFLSIEFQQTGYLVYRIYKTSYGNAPDAPVPIKFSEFLSDTQQIGQGVVVGQTGWEQKLENNKQAFAGDFVSRSRFTTAYPTTMTPAQFVDALFANAGVTPSSIDRAAAINEFGSTTANATARSRALRRVAENSTLAEQEFNRAFVLMQYFGYLRRNPNDAPDGNFAGYNFWLNKLDSFHGDFVQAEMVRSFLVSDEYRKRFNQ